jgi:hypothetical protein
VGSCPPPTPNLEGHPLSAVRDCLFSIFAATLHIWRPPPPSATWGRAMPWWQGTHLTWGIPQSLRNCIPPHKCWKWSSSAFLHTWTRCSKLANTRCDMSAGMAANLLENALFWVSLVGLLQRKLYMNKSHQSTTSFVCPSTCNNLRTAELIFMKCNIGALY